MSARLTSPTLAPIVAEIMARDAERLGISAGEARERAVATIPLRRANTPEDIAGMCVFLASDAARNVSGQSLHVDGALVPD